MNNPVCSPIALLGDAIAAAPFAIAPEKEAQLRDDPMLMGFGLAISDDDGFSIRVNIDTKEATLPVFSLEYLWCFSFMILRLVEEYQAAQRDQKSTFDFKESQCVSQAVDLLNWAHGRMLRGDRSPWPEGAPKPEQSPADDSVELVVSEVFLCAIAWIIHHEIAHIRLRHGIETVYSTQEEIDADAAATDWIFSGEQNSDMRFKRQLGMAVALLSMQFLEEPQGKDSKVKSHPPSLERLDRCFEQAQVARDGFIRALTTVALQFQLANQNLQSVLDGNSWDEIMGDAMVAFVTAGRD